MPLPTVGERADEVIATLASMRASDVDWKAGRAFTLAYCRTRPTIWRRGVRPVHDRQRFNTDAFRSTVAFKPGRRDRGLVGAGPGQPLHDERWHESILLP
jgi:hypothetical protein